MKISKTLQIVLFFAIVICYYVFIGMPSNEKKAYERYVRTYQLKIDNKITNVRTNRGLTILRFDGIAEEVFVESTYNYNLTPSFIGDFVKQGMWAYKSNNSDSLFIGLTKPNRKNLFVIGDRNLNED